MDSWDYLETQDLCLDEPAMSASSFGKRDNQFKGPSSGLTRRRKKTGIAEETRGRGRGSFFNAEVVSPDCLSVDHMLAARA